MLDKRYWSPHICQCPSLCQAPHARCSKTPDFPHWLSTLVNCVTAPVVSLASAIFCWDGPVVLSQVYKHHFSMRGFVKSEVKQLFTSWGWGKAPKCPLRFFPLCGGNKASRQSWPHCCVKLLTAPILTHKCVCTQIKVACPRLGFMRPFLIGHFLSFLLLLSIVVLKKEQLCPLGSRTGIPGCGFQLMSVTGLVSLQNENSPFYTCR